MVLYQLVSKSGCANYQHFRKACLYGKPYTPRERVKVMNDNEMARLDAVHMSISTGLRARFRKSFSQTPRLRPPRPLSHHLTRSATPAMLP
eukprot:3733641-Prymnesium_polylepis.1